MSPVRHLWAVLLILGCAKALKPEAGAIAPTEVLVRARGRGHGSTTCLPGTECRGIRARYRIKVRSEALDLAANTHGVLLAARPERGHLAILGPLGGPVVTVTGDGSGLGVVLPRESRQLVAVDADRVLSETTGGAVGLSDLLAILLGDLPFPEAAPASERARQDGRVEVEFTPGAQTRATVVLDPATATPVELVAHDRDGVVLLEVRYGPFAPHEGLGLVPTAILVRVRPLDLELDLQFRSWEVVDPPPEVFALRAPEGFVVESLEAMVQRSVRKALDRGGR